MKNEITMELLVGRNVITGETQPAGLGDTDEIKCNGRRIGFINHSDGAGIRFLLPRNRIADSTLQEVVDKVSELRQEQGKAALGEVHTFLTNPEKLKAALAAMADEDTEEKEEDDE